MADWSYGGVRIYVQDFTVEASQIIARLNPLEGGTLLHIFGNDTYITKVNGYVVGISGATTLIGYTADGTSYQLNNPYSASGVFYYLNKITAKVQRMFCQTLDQTQDEDAPVYLVDLELFPDV